MKSKTSATRAQPATQSPAKGPWFRRPWVILPGLLVALSAAGAFAFWDWWQCLPPDTQATYVGRDSCIECHRTEAELWTGSHHDLAMDPATPETVLGDFDDARLEHFGITSRMYRRDGKYLIHTEGPDGELTEFEIEYVLGVTPLQQYMVEFDRPANMPANEIARLQVLRVSWDTLENRWFYLPPPDVSDKLAPNDPLHWTRAGQNWNHMCAECHSTNLQKNYDVATRTYHTTFSEIDVSCEACHGPGSVHVQLAESRSLFWDRKLGYGLASLKDADSHVQIEACAPCHSRRRVVYPGYRPGQNYYECYANELLRPLTYYADGQILDEVYVYGSFIQSKMYHKDIRCTDCHDAHSMQLKHPGNQLCTSCHQHPEAKYDAPVHHRHDPERSGALCAECHMPASPFMEVDFRSDHSLRIPRPDLSVALGTPNACTGCHVQDRELPPEKKLPPEKTAKLTDYSKWLAAARAGDQEVRDELARVDRWSAEWVVKWYGPRDEDEEPHFAHTLARAWQNDPAAIPQLMELARNRRKPGMIRATALLQLAGHATPQTLAAAQKALRDPDPQVRAVAAANLEALPRRPLLENLTPLLEDPSRLVRTEAARVLAGVPKGALTARQLKARDAALEELRRGLLANGDQASAHMSLGILAERLAQTRRAAQAYRAAIAVQPDVTGPRSNLAALLERHDRPEEAARLRREELQLLERDAGLAPDSAPVQYRYGLSLYLHGRHEEALTALEAACRLEPNVPDFLLGLTLLYQKLQRWDEARAGAARLVRLRGDDPTYQQLQAEIQQQAAADGG